MKHLIAFLLISLLAPLAGAQTTPQNLTQYCGDTVTHSIALTRSGAAFTPGSAWSLIFTAKRQARDIDDAALIQKATGAGILVTGSTAAVSLLAPDTVLLTVGDMVWDIQAQNLTTGDVATVAIGRLALLRDVTRKLVTSIPIITTAPPLLTGPPGESAYQIAVDNGFTGTSAEWLASLGGGGGGASWGGITGSIDSQSDLWIFLESLATRDTPSLINQLAITTAPEINGGSGYLRLRPNDLHMTSSGQLSISDFQLDITTSNITGSHSQILPNGDGTYGLVASPSGVIALTDISGIGSSASHPSSDFATAAQGSQAATALQPASIGSTVQAYAANLTGWAAKSAYAGTLSITSGKTLSASNSLNMSGNDGSTLNIGSGGTLGTAAYTASSAYAAAIHTQAETTITFTDLTTSDASTAAHGFAPKAAAPASGLRNVLGIDNGETVRSDKALFSATVPSALGTAAAGSAMTAARADHVHAFPTAAVDARFPASIGSLRHGTVFTYSNNGSGSGASATNSHASLASGTTATGYGRAILFDDISSEGGSSGTGLDCSKSYDASMILHCGYSIDTGVVRFICGGVPGTGPAAANANALSAKGWGFEIHHITGGVTEFRLFGYDTSYQTTSWVAVDVMASIRPVMLRKVGAVLTLYVATTANGEFPAVANITSGSIAPTSGAIPGGGTTIELAAVSYGTGSAGTSASCWLASDARLYIY